jgi:hypothetical protein
MLMLMVARCADAAEPLPAPGGFDATGVTGLMARRLAGKADEPARPHAETASAVTAQAARNLMFMVPPEKPQ